MRVWVLTSISPPFCSMNSQCLISPMLLLPPSPLIGLSSRLVWELRALLLALEFSWLPRPDVFSLLEFELLNTLNSLLSTLRFEFLLLSLLAFDTCTVLIPCTTVIVLLGSSKIRVNCFNPDLYTGSENFIFVFNCLSAILSARLSDEKK